jgi:hypothetical protein
MKCSKGDLPFMGDPVRGDHLENDGLTERIHEQQRK